MIEITTAAYNGWEHCLVMRNKYIKLIVTTDIGPRIISFGPDDGGVNMFHEQAEHQGLSGSKEYLSYGGHRLWHSPQIGDRPSQPDNEMVSYTISDDAVDLVCPEEPATRVWKEMLIRIAPDENRVFVRHRIYNNNPWPIRIASWALSVMHSGGVEILPIPQEHPPDYLPGYMICYWPWTRPNDHRFTLGGKYMILRHDPHDARWFKIGYRNTEGWGAYFFDGLLFVKRCLPVPGAEYPDFGASFETFTDNYMVEMETLSPLKTIAAGDCVEHTEEWRLICNIALPESEEEIDEKIVPLCK
jgi:hypothetical protein